MSIITEEVENTYTQKVVTGFTCNKCKITHKYVKEDFSTVIEFQEMFHYATTGGYGSI